MGHQRRLASNMNAAYIFRSVFVVALMLSIYCVLCVHAASQMESKIAKNITSIGGMVQTRFAGPAWVPMNFRKHMNVLQRIAVVNLWGKDVPSNIYLDCVSLHNLTELNINDTHPTDDDIRTISCVNTLHSIGLQKSGRTDYWLEHICRLHCLRTLDIRGTLVTDSGMVLVARLKHLEKLYLDNTSVSDIGLRHLSRASGIKYLALSGTAITDRGLHSVAALRNLEAVWLTSTHIGGYGLKSMRDLPRLEVIDLSYTEITDDCVEYLGQMKALLFVDLHGTGVTDDGLKPLEQFTGRRVFVDLSETQVTSDGVAKLRAALPECDEIHCREK